jgi:hypothetical protein
MKTILLGTLLLTSTAAIADATDPSTWPSGKLHIDKSDDDGANLSVQFTDPDQKKHDIQLSIDFGSGQIRKCSFDGQVLDKVPQYRALAKYFTDHSLGSYRANDALNCTHPGADRANETNPTCKGWSDTAKEWAEDTKNGPIYDKDRAAKVGVVLWVEVLSSGDMHGPWSTRDVKVKQVIKNDPNITIDKDKFPIWFHTMEAGLAPGEGVIYLEQAKDKKGTMMWSLLGGNRNNGTSDWFKP